MQICTPHLNLESAGLLLLVKKCTRMREPSYGQVLVKTEWFMAVWVVILWFLDLNISKENPCRPMLWSVTYIGQRQLLQFLWHHIHVIVYAQDIGHSESRTWPMCSASCPLHQFLHRTRVSYISLSRFELYNYFDVEFQMFAIKKKMLHKSKYEKKM
jgi:hypothetical protein